MKFVIILALFTATVSAASTKKVDWSQVKPFDANPLLPRFNNAPGPAGRITNGAIAEPGQFPYQAGLLLYVDGGAYWCGGSIISDRWILTAAHCTDSLSEGVDVYLGAWDRSNNKEASQQIIYVSKNNVIVHEEWNPTLLENDISLIKLPIKIQFNDYIQPIALPKISNNYTERKIGKHDGIPISNGSSYAAAAAGTIPTAPMQQSSVEAESATSEAGQWSIDDGGYMDNEDSVRCAQKMKPQNNRSMAPKQPSFSFDFTNFFISVYASYAGARAIASGWGRISDEAAGVTDKLRWIEVPIMSNSGCSPWYFGSVKATNICIKTTGGTSTCNGDSGGPLVLVEETPVLIGATSFGIALGCEVGWPGVFTRVTSYLDWIAAKSGVVNN